jgi:hypothetical protein
VFQFRRPLAGQKRLITPPVFSALGGLNRLSDRGEYTFAGEFVDFSTGGSVWSNDTTMLKPAGVVAGDLMVMFVWNKHPYYPLTGPPGWTQHVDDNDLHNGPDVEVFSLVYSSGSSWFVQGVGYKQIHIVAYRGVTKVNVAGIVSTRTTNTTIAAPGITPTEPGVLIASYGLIDAFPGVAAPTDMVARAASNADSNSATAAYTFDNLTSPPGATGGVSAFINSANFKNGILVQLS